MYIKSNLPTAFHKGLYVTSYNDHKDQYMMTSFTMVFTEPDSERIDFNTFRTIGKLFWHLLHNDCFVKNRLSIYFKNLPDCNAEYDITNLDINFENNLISFNIENWFTKDAAFELVATTCRDFISLEKGEPSDSPYIQSLHQGFDKAAEIVNTYLSEVTEEGRYEYAEDIS